MNKNEEYLAREKKYIYTSTVGEPILSFGDGVWVTDADGKKYLDGTSQISLLNTGYSPYEIKMAMNLVFGSGVHSCISADYPFKIEIPFSRRVGALKEYEEISRAALAKKLIELTDPIMPFEKKVMFEVSGATAVNAAAMLAMITYGRAHGWDTVKLAKYFFRADDIFVPSHYAPFMFSLLAFEGAFHGRHGIAKLLTDSKSVHLWGLSSSCAVGRIDFPFCEEIGALDKIDMIIRRLSQYAPVIGFFFEPVQGEGGINVPDKVAFRELCDFLRGKGIPLIADEIQAGLGRTGKMFACEHFGIQPDMVLLSKSLAAGLPLGVVVASVEKFPDLEPGMHSGSMHCTPLACAVAQANLPLIERNLKNAEQRGEFAMKWLRYFKHNFHPFIVDARGLGLLLGIEMISVDVRNKFVELCRNTQPIGLILAPCGVKTARFCLPIIIKHDEMCLAIDIMRRALEMITSF